MGKRTKMLKAMKASGEDICNDRASERVSSRVSLRAPEASLGNQRRLIGMLKLEISSKSRFSSPLVERNIMNLRACAVALPGVELPGIKAGDNMLLLLPAATNGARKSGPSSK